MLVDFVPLMLWLTLEKNTLERSDQYYFHLQKCIMVSSHPPFSILCCCGLQRGKYIKEERISVVFLKLRSMDACRARGTFSVFKTSWRWDCLWGTEELVSTFLFIGKHDLDPEWLIQWKHLIYFTSSLQIITVTVSNYLTFCPAFLSGCKNGKGWELQRACYYGNRERFWGFL